MGLGTSWEEAIDDVEWRDGDVLVVGSSPAAPAAQVFLGSRASRIIRHSPVPVAVYRGEAGSRYGPTEMKFHATVEFEFSAPDVGEAGRRLQALLDQAAEGKLETKSLELATPSGRPVTLPTPPART